MRRKFFFWPTANSSRDRQAYSESCRGYVHGQTRRETVTLADTNANAAIYYTLDESMPSAVSTR